VKAAAFPWNSNPHILGIPAGDELRSRPNKPSLPSSSLACGLPSPTFTIVDQPQGQEDMEEEVWRQGWQIKEGHKEALAAYRKKHPKKKR